MDLKLKSNNIIFIEETTFLAEGFYKFLQELTSDLQDKKLMIYVERNIEKTISYYKESSRIREAYIIEGFIDIIYNMGYLSFIETKGYLDFNELEEVIKNNKQANILILTQKEYIFKSLINVKNKYKNILIAKIAQEVIPWDINIIYASQAFYVENDNYINKIDIENIKYVYSPKYGYLYLDKSKSYQGGEGILFSTYNKQLCKLYFSEHQTYTNYKKIEYMLNIDVYNPYINWPQDILFYKNNFVGYLMDEISGARSLDLLRIDQFPGFSIFDRYVLCLNLLLNIDYLHKKNIIIGDLKLDNILVKSPEEVYLVDCGSYQIGDYSCNVCHPEYTKKVFTSDELKQKLRTLEDEYYPINKILFEVLIGKNPNYNRFSGEVDIENKNNFYFPLDFSEVKKYTRELTLWRALSERMREFFYYYFKEDKITYISQWIDELNLFIKNAREMKAKGEM